MQVDPERHARVDAHRLEGRPAAQHRLVVGTQQRHRRVDHAAAEHCQGERGDDTCAIVLRVTATSDRKTHARSLFAGIAGDYDRWAQLLSFGQDRRWHDLMIETIEPAAAREGAVVADVATGTAAVAIALARRYPCRVVGVDQSPEMLAGGARRVEAAGLADRIELVEGQAERLPVAAGSVDALTHTYLLRYVDDPPGTLARSRLRSGPGG